MRNKAKVIKIIRKSLEHGTSVYNACQSAGINHATLWRWRKKIKRIDRYIETLLEGRTSMVEDALYKSAVGGNTTAITFWLKNRGKNWKDDATQPVIPITIINHIPRNDVKEVPAGSDKRF